MASTTSRSDHVPVMVNLKSKKNESLWAHPVLFLREEMGSVSRYPGAQILPREIWPILWNVCQTI